MQYPCSQYQIQLRAGNNTLIHCSKQHRMISVTWRFPHAGNPDSVKVPSVEPEVNQTTALHALPAVRIVPVWFLPSGFIQPYFFPVPTLFGACPKEWFSTCNGTNCVNVKWQCVTLFKLVCLRYCWNPKLFSFCCHFRIECTILPAVFSFQGIIEPFSEQKLQVRFLPGVPERFVKSFSIQVIVNEIALFSVYIVQTVKKSVCVYLPLCCVCACV